MADTQTKQNPFPGLRPFQFHQRDLFFGRESHIEASLSRLEQTRFLAIVGPSGSGKSSLLRAGIIPDLYEGRIEEAGKNWQVAIFNPGDDPLGNMVDALNDAEMSVQRADLENNENLVDVIQQSGLASGTNLLLVVDQFEELFRYNSNSGFSFEDASYFVRLLLNAVHQHASNIFVLLTMRADFLGQSTAFQGLPEAINTGQYLIPRMTPDQVRDAIEKPISYMGAEITDDLTQRILGELGDDQDMLPIMQHALMRTWDYWIENHNGEGPLDTRHYEAIGTVQEALSYHAEEVYDALPSEELRRVTQVLFKSLIDKSSNNRGVRRPIPLRQVAAVAGVAESEVMTVAEYFRSDGRWFITPFPEIPLESDSILDIVHESLMRVWTRLRGWIEEEGASAQLYLRLANTASLYQEGRAGLYQGPDLELALDWFETEHPTAAWAMRYDSTYERAMAFLEHSRKERDFDIATREARQRKQMRRARMLAIASGSASLVFLLLSLFALDLFFKEEENRQLAVEQQKVAEAQRQEAELARQEAIVQQKEAENQRQLAEVRRQEAEEAQKEAVNQRRLAEAQRQEAENQRQEAELARQEAIVQQKEAENQRRLAEAQRQEAEEQRTKAERLRLLSIARTLSVQAVKIQRNEQVELGALLALQAYKFNQRYGGPTQSADIYEALRLAREALYVDNRGVLRGHNDAVRALAFTPNGEEMISVGDDGAVRMWSDLEGNSQMRDFAQVSGRLRSLAISPDGTLLVVGGNTGALRIWSLVAPVQAPQILYPWGIEASGFAIVSKLAFSADGRYLAVGSLDGRIWIQDVSNLSGPPVFETKASSRIHAMTFGPQNRLVYGTEDGHIELMDVQTFKTVSEYSIEEGIRALAFGQDGEQVAVGTENGNILIWDLDHLDAPGGRLIGHTSAVMSLSFNADGRLLASGSLDKTVRIWDTQNPEAESIPIVHDGWVWTVAFRPNGTLLASGGSDRNILISATQAGALAEQICGKIERNLTDREWKTYVGEDIPYERTCPDLPDGHVLGEVGEN